PLIPALLRLQLYARRSSLCGFAGPARYVQCAERAGFLRHLPEHHVSCTQFRSLAADQIPRCHEATRTRHVMDCNLSVLRGCSVLDRHRTDADGRHGVHGDCPDSVHFRFNHRPEYVSELTHFKTCATGKRCRERLTRCCDWWSPGTVLPRSRAENNWRTALGTSGL